MLACMGIIGQCLQRASGRWMTLQGQFKRRAHIASLIIVHVGVGQRCRAPDGESPALLPIMSTRNVSAGLDESSRKVQKCEHT